jgi:hypothetical protein
MGDTRKAAGKAYRPIPAVTPMPASVPAGAALVRMLGAVRDGENTNMVAERPHARGPEPGFTRH